MTHDRPLAVPATGFATGLALLIALAAGGALAQESDTATEPVADAAAEPAAGAAEAAADAAATDAAAPDWAVAYEEGGRYYTADDVPTFNVQADGTVDWMTFSGFRRYHAECHVCHGPDGEGSTYAPALKDSVMRMDYYAFYDVVVNGKQNVGGGQNNVMPAFGDNPNVMCYLDDIWVYLRAHGSGTIPRGRPASREDKSDAIAEAENACMGT